MSPVVIDPAEATARQARVAGALRAGGFTTGDRLGLCVPSSAALLHVIGGALRSGVVPVVISPQLLAAEREPIRRDADVRRWIEDVGELEALLDGPSAELAAHPLARPMHYTSGTTGWPKGVWSGLLDEEASRRLVAEEVEMWQFAAEDVHLVCSPLHHSAPIRFALTTLLAGGTVVLPGPFSVASAVASIRHFAVTTTFCSPAHLHRFQAADALGVLASLRLVAHAGAPCPAPLKRRAIEEIGAERLWEFYGSTEGQFTACSSPEWLQRPGTVGRARPGRRLEIDADETVWCHAPPWARWEYWRDPERTGAAWRGDAFTVGDLGRLDDDGYLFLSGRRGDLIISGGVNVYPAEVEQALLELPGVADVAVFGRPDERWGQRVCAAVAGSVNAGDVEHFAASRLAPFKRPKEVHVVDAIPRAGLAKLRRHRLAIDLGLEPDPDGA